MPRLFGALAMAQCRYCGKPTKRSDSQHVECHDRHARAVLTIPEFFARLLESPIPTERFGALLLDAAKASFIGAGELRELCIDGIFKLIRSVLDHRLLSAEEEERIVAIKEALRSNLANVPGLDDVLTQIEILRDLGQGKVPDRVIVEGPMPISLRRGETILWIFNGTKVFRPEANQEKLAPQIHVPIANDVYFGLNIFDKEVMPLLQKQKGEIGDLVLTNYNIYFLSLSGRQSRRPISRISGFHPYHDGVNIHFNQGSMTYVLDDSWFLANAIARLTQLMHAGNAQKASLSASDGT